MLHIDTSADTGIIALSEDGKILINQISEESRNHAAAINIIIESVLEKAAITIRDVSAIAVCGGPGSYTGLRIGLTTAKGLCYASDLPLIMDNKLTLLSYHAYLKYNKAFDHYVAIMVARDKEYFINIHDNNFNCCFQPKHISGDELINILADKGKIHITSNVAQSVIDDCSIPHYQFETDINIRLDAWAKVDFDKFNSHEFEILSSSEPFYLKQVYTHK